MSLNHVIGVGMGDADRLPKSENVPVANGALLHPDSIGEVSWEPASRLTYTLWMRLREYGCSDPLEVAYEIVPKSEESDMGWTLFSAEQIDRVGAQPVSLDCAAHFRAGPATVWFPTAGPL